MNAFLTLDYELFFGSRTGTVERCLIEPTAALLRVTQKYRIPLVLFVDFTFLDAASKSRCFDNEVRAIKMHLESLQSMGHEIQLHLHPHWYYSISGDGGYVTDTSKYKLADLPAQDAKQIVVDTAALYEQLCGARPLAYRAGGWCIQGFDRLADTFYESGIRVDSTLYDGGFNHSEFQGYDFRGIPDLPQWRFEVEPDVVEPEGRFFELPISSLKLSPFFYWHRILQGLRGGDQQGAYGDGSPTSMSVSQFARFVLYGSQSVASVDGLKAKTLSKSYTVQQGKYGEQGSLVLLGHPKALTRDSINQFDLFMQKHQSLLSFKTVGEWYGEQTS